jgi:hypothetical protein
MSSVWSGRPRTAGDRHSWREIGDVLGTSRQAAFRGFGHPADPRTGEPMSDDISPSAADRAVEIFAWHGEGRWEEILAELDERMRALLNAELMARAWAHMAGRSAASREPASRPPAGRVTTSWSTSRCVSRPGTRGASSASTPTAGSPGWPSGLHRRDRQSGLATRGGVAGYGCG